MLLYLAGMLHDRYTSASVLNSFPRPFTPVRPNSFTGAPKTHEGFSEGILRRYLSDMEVITRSHRELTKNHEATTINNSKTINKEMATITINNYPIAQYVGEAPAVYKNIYALATVVTTATSPVDAEISFMLPTATTVLPKATLVSDRNSAEADDNMSDITDHDDMMNSEASNMDEQLQTWEALSIEEQLFTIPRRATPHTTREFQELVSQTQPCFHVAAQPSYEAMKSRRKTRQAVTAGVGGAVGFVTLGPFGLAIGVVGGAVITKQVCQARERRVLKGYAELRRHLNAVPAKLGELV
jgi:hypothetical protein